MKNTIRIYLFAILLFSFFSNAVEITKIRYGKTEQKNRLVIESESKLIVEQRWSNGFLSLFISDVQSRPKNDVFTVNALSVIKKIEATGSELLLELPIRTKQSFKLFQLAKDHKNKSRLVIDWGDYKSTENPEILINKRTKEQTFSSLQIEAKNAMTDRKYRLAISLLNKLQSSDNIEHQAFALEYLGVSRERSYQYAFAKKHYQEFIEKFSQHPSKYRVSQRLAALNGIQNIEKTKKLKRSSQRKKISRNQTRGSLATDYRQSDLVNDLGERRQTLSSIGIDLDVRGNYQLDSGLFRLRFSGGHYQDLTESGDDTKDRLRYLNASWSSSDSEYHVDLGRQRSRGKGIFGRFDGLMLGYNFNSRQKVNMVVGAPVASSKVLSIDPERNFFGLSFDWLDVVDNVDMSLFALNQTIGDLTDRQAIGGDFRYVQNSLSAYGFFDYDVFHSELNAILISGSYLTDKKTRYHVSYNQRKSPYISTRNALIGQAADSLEELQELLITDEEILDLAADRTLQSRTSTFQLSHPLSKDYNISGSLTWNDLSGAPASGGVSEIAKPGAQLYYNIYLQGSKLFSTRDSNQIGLRVSKLSQSDVNSIYINSTYRWKSGWSLSGKLRYDNRTNHSGGGQQSVSPTFRVQYQSKENYLYADFGSIFYTNQVSGFDDVSTDIYYYYLGYRYFY